MNPRLKKTCARIAQEGLDGLLVSSSANITYLTGYQSRDSYLVVSPKGSVYFTDSRYFQEARAFLKKDFSVVDAGRSLFKTIASAAAGLKIDSLGFEERYLAYAEYKKISGYLNDAAGFLPTHGLVEKARMLKDAGEIHKIKRAVDITTAALEFIRPLLVPGKKEIEVVAELEHFIRYQGSSDSAFQIIAASGPNSAYAHHISGQRRLKKNEPVLIDIGVEFDGYKSDLTRVFFLGKINILARRIYNIVLAAQRRALAAVHPGKPAKEIDTAGRRFIASKGYGRRFGHNLGHGIGLEVHEEPHISGSSSEILRPGMVFTLEPAIYLPGKFGIRIEDMVLVTRKGCVFLSGPLHK